MFVSRYTQALFSWLLTALLLSSSGACLADDKDIIQGDLQAGAKQTTSQGEANQLVNPPAEIPPPRLSPADAANLVRDKMGGQVMSVSTKRNPSGTIYGVKILNSGRMRVILVDGQTGQLLN